MVAPDEKTPRFSYQIKPHSNSSQLCIGTYQIDAVPPVTRAEIEARCKGTFGGRFAQFGGGGFEYVAYTD